MLSVALIVATAPARCANSASVAAALSRIACAKADHSGICGSVMPSCDCNVLIRWSTAACVAAEGVEAALGCATGAGAGGAVCAKPIEGTSIAARAKPYTWVELGIPDLPNLVSVRDRANHLSRHRPSEPRASRRR